MIKMYPMATRKVQRGLNLSQIFSHLNDNQLCMKTKFRWLIMKRCSSLGKNLKRTKNKTPQINKKISILCTRYFSGGFMKDYCKLKYFFKKRDWPSTIIKDWCSLIPLLRNIPRETQVISLFQGISTIAPHPKCCSVVRPLSRPWTFLCDHRFCCCASESAMYGDWAL